MYYKGITVGYWAEACNLGYLLLKSRKLVNGQSAPRLYFTSDLRLAGYYASLFGEVAEEKGLIIAFPVKNCNIIKDDYGFTAGSKGTEYYIENCMIPINICKIIEKEEK